MFIPPMKYDYNPNQKTGPFVSSSRIPSVGEWLIFAIIIFSIVFVIWKI